MNISEYEKIISDFYKIIESGKDIADVRLAPDKWTLKEMVAHLVDSASNNHQRFIRLQSDTPLIFPGYDPEQWRTISHSGEYDFGHILELWRSFNLYLLHIIRNIEKKYLDNYWDRDGDRITLDDLVVDYFKHMTVHLNMYQERIEEIRAAK
jgi:hypothetical protein